MNQASQTKRSRDNHNIYKNPYNAADARHVNFSLTANISFEFNFLTIPFWEGMPLRVDDGTAG